MNRRYNRIQITKHEEDNQMFGKINFKPTYKTFYITYDWLF